MWQLLSFLFQGGVFLVFFLLIGFEMKNLLELRNIIPVLLFPGYLQPHLPRKTRGFTTATWYNKSNHDHKSHLKVTFQDYVGLATSLGVKKE